MVNSAVILDFLPTGVFSDFLTGVTHPDTSSWNQVTTNTGGHDARSTAKMWVKRWSGGVSLRGLGGVKRVGVYMFWV